MANFTIYRINVFETNSSSTHSLVLPAHGSIGALLSQKELLNNLEPQELSLDIHGFMVNGGLGDDGVYTLVEQKLHIIFAFLKNTEYEVSEYRVNQLSPDYITAVSLRNKLIVERVIQVLEDQGIKITLTDFGGLVSNIDGSLLNDLRDTLLTLLSNNHLTQQLLFNEHIVFDLSES